MWSLLFAVACSPLAEPPTDPPERSDDVNETGYLDPSLIRVTAADALADTAVDVFVIGLEGALSAPVGTLILGDVERAPNSDGSFVMITEGVLGDVLILTHIDEDGEQDVDVVLEPLDGVPVDVADGDGSDWVESSPDGLVVHLNLLMNHQEYLVFNVDGGHSVVGSDGDLELPGVPGDEVCATGSDSPALCTIAAAK